MDSLLFDAVILGLIAGTAGFFTNHKKVLSLFVIAITSILSNGLLIEHGKELALSLDQRNQARLIWVIVAMSIYVGLGINSRRHKD